MSYNIDMGGTDLVVNTISIGASTPGAAGTLLNSTDLTGITPGTATASKAVVLGASKDIATITTAGITTANVGTAAISTQLNPAAAATIKSNLLAITGSSHAGTMTGHWAAKYTTESLSTVAGATQAEVITLTGVAAGDIALVSLCGGTAVSGAAVQLSAVCTTDTITVTITNNNTAAALSGTVIFNVLWLKA